MRSIPPQAKRTKEFERIVASGDYYSVIALQETMFGSHYRVFIDVGSAKFELYTQRGKPRTFSSLDTLYKYCQNIGVYELRVQVSRNSPDKPEDKS